MSTAHRESLFTVDQYLAIERGAEERHVYLDGEIYAMAGESLPHGTVSVNVIGLFFGQLRGKECQAFTKDMKVRSGPLAPRSGRLTKGLFSYPDVTVVCGSIEFHDDHRDVILNPTAIAEVLSESTEAFDRGEKFIRLRDWNPSLRDYLLISQDQPRIEHFSRQPDNSWNLRTYVGLDAEVTIASIGCTLKLADVYDRVKFASQAVHDEA